VQALFVVFALHLAERREEAATLLGVLAMALPRGPEEPDDGPLSPLTLPETVRGEVAGLLTEHAMIEPASAITSRHGWTQTALMALLNQARLAAGVLAPAQFAWLKLVDRPLWYALHSLGFEADGVGRYLHPNPRVEAAGARDHWEAERIVGLALVEPSVDRAVDALRRAITPRPGTGGAEDPPSPQPMGGGQGSAQRNAAASHAAPPDSAASYTATDVSALTKAPGARS
jgi:intracellular multiplication protein IcmP